MVTYDSRPSAFTQLTTTAEWEYLHSAMAGLNAIDASVGSAMVPSLDTGGRNIVIADGVVVIKGQLWRCDAPVSTPIPAASAQNRIDRLVIRLNRGATSAPTVVQPIVITGSPSSTPVIPPITQTLTGIWDIPVAHWTSTSAGALTTLVDDRRTTNDPWHDMRPLSGSFVGTISGANPPQYRFSNDLVYVEVAGVIQSPTPAGNYNNVTWFTFPPRYSPVSPNLGQQWPATLDVAITTLPKLVVKNNGTIVMANMPTSLAGGSNIGIYGRYTLDDQYGFITA
jgi:hypothetical protein